MTYVPTGFREGRPCYGEVRPRFAHNDAFQKWYYDWKARDPEGLSFYMREKSRRFRLNNPEKIVQYRKTAKLRKAAWDSVVDKSQLSNTKIIHDVKKLSGKLPKSTTANAFTADWPLPAPMSHSENRTLHG